MPEIKSAVLNCGHCGQPIGKVRIWQKENEADLEMESPSGDRLILHLEYESIPQPRRGSQAANAHTSSKTALSVNGAAVVATDDCNST